MLVARIHRGIHAKVNSYAAAHNLLAIYLLAYCDCGVDIEEGHYDTFERLERCPSVNRCVGVYGFSYLNEVRRMEDFGFNEVLRMVNMILLGAVRLYLL